MYFSPAPTPHWGEARVSPATWPVLLQLARAPGPPGLYHGRMLPTRLRSAKSWCLSSLASRSEPEIATVPPTGRGTGPPHVPPVPPEAGRATVTWTNPPWSSQQPGLVHQMPTPSPWPLGVAASLPGLVYSRAFPHAPCCWDCAVLSSWLLGGLLLAGLLDASPGLISPDGPVLGCKDSLWPGS